MRVGAKVTAAMVVAAAATVLAVPAGMSESVQQDWRRFTGDPGQACFDYEKALLADPDGARLESHSVGETDPDEVTIKYRAGQGDEPQATEVLCVVRAGKVSEPDTVRGREHAAAVKRVQMLMAEFECLEQQKQALRKGHSVPRTEPAAPHRCADAYARIPRSASPAANPY